MDCLMVANVSVARSRVSLHRSPGPNWSAGTLCHGTSPRHRDAGRMQ